MTVMKRLFIVGAVLAVAGLVWGLKPVHRDGAACGTAFTGAPAESATTRQIDAMVADNGVYNGDAEAACADARGSGRTVAFVLLGAAAVIIVGGWVLSGQASRSRS